MVEANLDDATPELLSRALDACLDQGALDAWIAPLTMKKGRPGHLLGALVPEGKLHLLCERIVRETPSLGVRHHAVGRLALERRFEKVETRFGPVAIKVASLAGEVLGGTPEWEDCVARAEAHGVPVRAVRDEALSRWWAGRY